jgi:8-oxo-dGTP pyrophosphatase MutT (NUDIX family)
MTGGWRKSEQKMFGAVERGAAAPPSRRPRSRRGRTIILDVDKEEIRRRLALSCPPEELGRLGSAAIQAVRHADVDGVGGADVPEGAAPPPGGAAPLTPAAVLVALIASPQGPEIILTQRTAEMRNHPAQVSLPGGRIEPEDAGPAAAALREAWEEVGLPPEQVELIGCLPHYQTVSDYCVHPFVGWVDGPVELIPDAGEVADIFLVPLAFVLDPDNHARESMLRDGEERSFYVLQYADRRIWGATAGMLVSLARALA